MAGTELFYLKSRQATWLELFFDLIFVVALGKLTHFWAHPHHGHLSEHVWLSLILTFIPMWWIWGKFSISLGNHCFFTTTKT